MRNPWDLKHSFKVDPNCTVNTGCPLDRRSNFLWETSVCICEGASGLGLCEQQHHSRARFPDWIRKETQAKHSHLRLSASWLKFPLPQLPHHHELCMNPGEPSLSQDAFVTATGNVLNSDTNSNREWTESIVERDLLEGSARKNYESWVGASINYK